MYKETLKLMDIHRNKRLFGELYIRKETELDK